MKKMLTTVVLAVTVMLSTSGCLAHVRPGEVEVYAPVGPPAPQVEVIGVAPGPGYFWVGGHHYWTGNAYSWRGGYWEHHRPGHAWVPGYWDRHARGHVWVEGRWR